ncbi:cytochrome oxidase I [Prauserella marina]|uniref:Xanthine dehydrogenase accessory factor n=1 Tax=Prauserella marina TaxID=530584 RepID=A0A222VK97_9PSEU|nr:XdhC family protein [Prauserella marina]ASR34193.1 cytochrome oxidase I [Prauserella marina]PWV70869.1 xanthine dehydrogenase accessory factor [Prauserella marina]SDE02051.1 xanthine dehydrogenase accessory factor [Prauserella marina]
MTAIPLPSALREHADSLRTQRTPFVLATVVRVQRPASARPGDRALVLADGTVEGFVGGTCAESSVRSHGIQALSTGESALLRITNDEPETGGGGYGEEGIVTVTNPCLSGGAVDIFLEPQLPPRLVYVFGDAPIARALLTVGIALGYDVRLTEGAALDNAADRGDAVIVASHGRNEESVLRAAIEAGTGYIGLVASRRRGAAVLASLGVGGAGVVHTPAGLDIGAATPEEVALSVYAELVATRPRRRAEKPAPEESGQQALDPVCGMTVAVSAATPSIVRADGARYFCGQGCARAFADDPVRYGSHE